MLFFFLKNPATPTISPLPPPAPFRIFSFLPVPSCGPGGEIVWPAWGVRVDRGPPVATRQYATDQHVGAERRTVPSHRTQLSRPHWRDRVKIGRASCRERV